ncbi:MAG TPA: Sec-independent protein translocase protein TatB [Acidimicrobiales bacterium]|jgi:sec-independent protein translocase protein TatB|nr:Sec-independent protein translocase protein TatB [Acidimicrobiales bacterium]
MFNIGGGELLVIVLIALIVLGPQRLPDAMRTFGRVVGEVRRISSGFQQELRDAFEDSDVADKASPPRRREAVPLAAAVAEANPDIDDDTEDEPADEKQAPPMEDAFEPELDDGVGRGTSVAPVIADALDAIVGPDDQPTSDRAPAAESGPELGDERAAS